MNRVAFHKTHSSYFYRKNFGIADVHHAQQTVTVQLLVQQNKTVLVNAPPGCTSRVQPLNVTINKSFKYSVRRQLETDPDENPEGRISAQAAQARDVTA